MIHELFIPDPGSRGQKGTKSRNHYTAYSYVIGRLQLTTGQFHALQLQPDRSLIKIKNT